MRSSDGSTGFCPRCGGRVSQDQAGKGWVRHLEYGGECQNDPYGQGERDEPPAEGGEENSQPAG